jgi:futalosine hydrolase
MRTLVLVPTESECRLLRPEIGTALGTDDGLELCGFGPVAAAARTAALLARHRPARVLLAGIAGRIDERLPLGSAARFARVACHGVGAGTGVAFVPAGDLGWPQWPGDPATGTPAIGDVIPCGWVGGDGPLLLSACAASGSPADVAARRRLFPAAAAEDMEGFAVAFACRLAGVPCEIVRGLSNAAGDRDPAGWVTADALAAAAAAAARILAEAP